MAEDQPQGEYRYDQRLIFFRLEQLERQVHDLAAFRTEQNLVTSKARQDVDAAHEKLRLLASRERYKAWSAIAAAFTAMIAAIVALLKR
jgi:hypothetical protein